MSTASSARASAVPHDVRTLSELFEGTSVFSDIPPAERNALLPLFTKKTFEAGEVMMREGDNDPHIYILGTGTADVVKKSRESESYVLRTLVAGESVGEMKLADETMPNSATVIAREPVLAWTLLIHDLERLDPQVRARLTSNIARVLADRLRTNNDTTVEAMQHELDQTRARVSGGVFAISLIAIMSIYNFTVAGLQAANPANLPQQAFLSPMFILTPCIPIAILIRRGRWPRSTYGLTLKNWPRVVAQAVLYSLPMLAALTAFKAVWIALDPKLKAEPLFDTNAIFLDGHFDLKFYVLSFVIYALVCPAQEFFTRSGLHTALDRFLPRTDGRANWPAILVSNLVFALAHDFIGFGFAIGAFLPGLFWGWLYDRQRSLVGVTVSHALVGTFALQVLGVQPIIGGH